MYQRSRRLIKRTNYERIYVDMRRSGHGPDNRLGNILRRQGGHTFIGFFRAFRIAAEAHHTEFGFHQSWRDFRNADRFAEQFQT